MRVRMGKLAEIWIGRWGEAIRKLSTCVWRVMCGVLLKFGLDGWV